MVLVLGIMFAVCVDNVSTLATLSPVTAGKNTINSLDMLPCFIPILDSPNHSSMNKQPPDNNNNNKINPPTMMTFTNYNYTEMLKY
jgi:hypothetical protein